MLRQSFGLLRSFSAFNEAAKNFAGVLSTELAYERANYAIDASVTEFLTSHNYEMFEEDDTTEVTLKKFVNCAQVEVVFQSKPSEFLLLANPGTHSDSEDNDEPGPSLDQLTPFIIRVKEPSSGSGFLANCSSAKGEFTLGTLTVSPEIDTIPLFIRNDRHDEFRGPNLRDLDEVTSTSGAP